MDYFVDNLAPDADVIHMTFGTNGDSQVTVTIDRDEHGVVSVLLVDNADGSETRMILGKEGSTQKL